MGRTVIRFRLVVVVTAVIACSWAVDAQNKPAQVTSPRIYIFDNGFIRGLDTNLFSLKREEIKEADFVDVSYLIVHPRGTLQFDSGEIPDSQFTREAGTVTDGVMSASKPLLPQLAEIGYKAADITYFALSHYHSDHTANANAFAGSTWIVQKADRDFMFGEKPQGIIQTDHFGALKQAKTKLLDNEDYDVFGDGSVRIVSAPGHTPGHQVLLVRLARRGPVVLAGDLYHYPEERTLDRVPTFEYNVEQSRAARAKVERVLKETGAELWIEHDMATHVKLPKSPVYVE